ncbi:unnamed protein product [Ectocarpus sp. 4 AP-2014]
MGGKEMLNFQSRRSPVLGTHAAVSSSQPLATDIGARILRLGGNAVDAAVAVSAALCVLEPCSTGLGGDMFMLYYEASTKQVHAVNGSGKAPAALSLERCLEDLAKATPAAAAAAAATGGGGSGPKDIPPCHPHSVTVPGAAAGWCDSVSKFGSGALTLSELMEPAAVLAEKGFPVSPITAHHWGLNAYQLETGPNKGRAALLMPNGRTPAAGEVFRNPDMAGVLRELGTGRKEGFYSGRIGEAMVKVLQDMGGVLTMEDLKTHTTAFVEPISVEFAGVRVYEVPPNGQGIAALLALNILKELGVVEEARATVAESGAAAAAAAAATAKGGGEAAYLHRLIEVLRLAFADTRWYCADMDKAEVPVKELLGQAYAAERAHLFDPTRASADVEKGSPTKSSCTVSFQVVDDQGNAVSFVNSNYMGFGSGIVPDGCGFSLQSRGSNFALDPEHPNVLAPGKRPYHTIIPCMVTSEATGELFATMTNMGAFMQPQGHVQLLSNLLLRGMDPQAAIDAPRFCIRDGMANGAVALEPWHHDVAAAAAGRDTPDGADKGGEGYEAVVSELQQMGHDIKVVRGHARCEMGRAQVRKRRIIGS